MAIYFNKLNFEERSILTNEMRHSGDSLKIQNINNKYVIDKHSSGGIGDKTSLIIAPLMAELGANVPMISGRGLGFTGGTLDKLESIPNFNVQMPIEKMEECVKEYGFVMCGQTNNLAPADKKIYSLRDVTSCVNEPSLITASILAKKLSEDLNGLVLDIKCGTGAFRKTLKEAEELANSLVKTANLVGVTTVAHINRMDYPIGDYVGNMCETMECIEAMDSSIESNEYFNILKEVEFDEKTKGYLKLDIKSNKHLLIYFTFQLVLKMYILSQKLEPEESFNKVREVWLSGKPLERFRQISNFQSGNFDLFLKESQLLKQQIHSDSEQVMQFKAPAEGYVSKFDGQKIGNIMVGLNAGRKVASDKINNKVSLKVLCTINQEFQEGDLLAIFYHPNFDKQVFFKQSNMKTTSYQSYFGMLSNLQTEKLKETKSLQFIKLLIDCSYIFIMDQYYPKPYTKKRYYTPSDIKVHNTANDCWVTFFSKVYDLTSLVQENIESEFSRPIINAAGTDITFWFDKNSEPRKHVDISTGKKAFYTPQGKYLHLDVNFEENQEFIPWWKNEKYLMGLVSEKTRKINIVNMLHMLTYAEDLIEVPSEETISEILLRYQQINHHAASYTWKRLGRPLDMTKTLEENGIEDETGEFERLNIPEEEWYYPAIHLYFNDDLTVA